MTYTHHVHPPLCKCKIDCVFGQLKKYMEERKGGITYRAPLFKLY